MRQDANLVRLVMTGEEVRLIKTCVFLIIIPFQEILLVVVVTIVRQIFQFMVSLLTFLNRCREWPQGKS